MILPSLSRVENQNHITNEFEELDMNSRKNIDLIDFSDPIHDSEYDFDSENYWKTHIDHDYYEDNNGRRLANELKSPTEGADLSNDEKKQSLLNCYNQTLCIEPHLELEPVYNVYYCSHNANTGVRFYYLIREGLILHPNLHLVDSPDKADIVVYLPESMRWPKSECGKSKYYSKLLILDEGDWPDLFTPDGYSPKQLEIENKNTLNKNISLKSWHLLYFKRSFIRRKSGDFKGLMGWLKKPVWNNVLPMTYPAANAYIYSPYKHHPQSQFQSQLQSQSQVMLKPKGNHRILQLNSNMTSWLLAMNISTDPDPDTAPAPDTTASTVTKNTATTSNINTETKKNNDLDNMIKNKSLKKKNKNQKKKNKMKNVQKVQVKVDQKEFQSKTSQIKRILHLLCTLRGSKGDPNRLRVQQWVQEYAKNHLGSDKWVAHQINSESRRTISKGYFGKMQQAQIIVTANPSGWEGDFRLMEAMSSGAMVMVDAMRVPRPFPLKHEHHVVYYNNRNKTEFFRLLDKYRNDIHARNRVAKNGYLHALKYHRAISFIDFVFRTLHIKLAKDAGDSYPNYNYDGFQLRKALINSNSKEARLQQRLHNN